MAIYQTNCKNSLSKYKIHLLNLSGKLRQIRSNSALNCGDLSNLSQNSISFSEKVANWSQFFAKQG